MTDARRSFCAAACVPSSTISSSTRAAETAWIIPLSSRIPAGTLPHGRKSGQVKFATNGGVRLAYDTQGSGPALVLVHANPFDHRLWLYQVARYARTFRIVNVDLRGYGESDQPDGPFTLRDMAD